MQRSCNDQGDLELPEYIEKCRQVTDACRWPENAKDMVLRNAVLLGLKNPKVYQKCIKSVWKKTRTHLPPNER